MSRRLAARTVPGITASHVPHSRSLSLCHPVLRSTQIRPCPTLRTTPASSTVSRNGTTRRYLVGHARKEKDQTSERDYGLVEDPDAWAISSGSDQLAGNDITLLHPKSQQTAVLNRHALRDSCECGKCVDPHSGQKNFGTTEMPDHLRIQSCRRTDDASLEVVWQDDFVSNGESHCSVYPPHRVRSWFNGSREGYPALPNRTIWDRSLFETSPSTVAYDDWISGGPGFHAALAQLWNYGLVFLDGVPKSEESVVTIATQIGHVMETFYGRTWDVRSKPQAENVAYTSTFLGLHQDLLYTRDPPRIQLLHCLDNTCDGGESIFSDSHRVASLMEIGPPELFNALKKRHVRYHYDKDGHFYEQLRPVIGPTVDSVFWSPPFQDPDQAIPRSVQGSEHYAVWLKAAKTFRTLLEDDKWLYERKLKPGQCVIFDNLRVLHGRRQFDTATGSRWLKGTYVSRDEWVSKTLTLAKEITTLTVQRVSNISSQAQKLDEQHKVWPAT